MYASCYANNAAAAAAAADDVAEAGTVRSELNTVVCLLVRKSAGHTHTVCVVTVCPLCCHFRLTADGCVCVLLEGKRAEQGAQLKSKVFAEPVVSLTPSILQAVH